MSKAIIGEKNFAARPVDVYLSDVNETQDLVFFDRYEQRLKTESIYGGKPLRWAYGTTLGRLCLEAVIKRRWFSSLYGRWADCGCSRSEVTAFIERFELDPDEFADPPGTFKTFNEFFHRRLKPAARPLPTSKNAVIFPADGRHFLVPDLSKEQAIYAKGQRFDLLELLGDKELAARFENGTAILSRLCPTDYHRFHFPLDGKGSTPRLINGALYSVNPIALAGSLARIWQNKRRVTVVTDSPVGDYLFLEIGATNVGTIVDTVAPESEIERGDEKGYFRFGGSMVITIFPEGAFVPADDLAKQAADGIELYARFGDTMGSTQ